MARERGQWIKSSGPAQLLILGANRLLVGTHVSERRRVAGRLRGTDAVGHRSRAALRPDRSVVQPPRSGASRHGCAGLRDIISGDLAQRLPAERFAR